jgi:hypothetical protein
MGDAAFLLEMRHFLRETHLQHHPEVQMEKKIFIGGDAILGDLASLVEI